MSIVRGAVVVFFLIATQGLCSGQAYTPGSVDNFAFETDAVDFLSNYCVDCHGEESPEGGQTLSDIGPVSESNTAAWRSIWAQVTLKEMPPQDAQQPTAIERLKFTDWIVAQLDSVMDDQGGMIELRDPAKGNFVDHELLYGELPVGIELKPTSSAARLWRITPQEHITRLNELINTEPRYDPLKPGLRTHGDAVPTNHGGELKLYFGTDRITHWQGGTVAYATAVKSIPAILSSARDHGLENYPDFYSVNSAEATQILAAATDVIRYMAYGPLSIANPEQITDDPKTYPFEGDIRGLPTSLIYSTKIVRPITPVVDLMNDEGINDVELRASVDYLFEALTFRPPSPAESDQYMAITKDSIDKLGKEDGVVLGLSAIFLDRDALFRPELAEDGYPDEHGRIMLRDWELGLALNHALRYIRPDGPLRDAIIQGRMRTRADVEREVSRMLDDPSIRKPRVMQFFRDFFDYDRGGYICKDAKALAATGIGIGDTQHYGAMFDATASTERLIELILAEDRNVLFQLLTTDQVVATKRDNIYFGRQSTRAEFDAAVAATRKATQEEVVRLNREVDAAAKALADAEAELKNAPDSKALKQTVNLRKKELAAANEKVAAARKRRNGLNHGVVPANLTGRQIFARVSRRSFGNGSMLPERILSTIPVGERLGILTHPSWLVSHSDAMDNHAIRRGKWIRERLLGGGIPDVPITVDAKLPDEPGTSLRERMRVTRDDYCWKCHRKMDPLGLPFEMYNHAGLYRTEELGRAIDASGAIIDSGDPSLDGEVKDAIELIQRIAGSERTEQVFVRHAFRFWMGRNETLNDGPVLQQAHRAYRDNGGSMRALIVSLLTSDAFLYRSRLSL